MVVEVPRSRNDLGEQFVGGRRAQVAAYGLTEKGLRRSSFVPSAAMRVLRDYTRMRVDLVRDRTRYGSRLESFWKTP